MLGRGVPSTSVIEVRLAGCLPWADNLPGPERADNISTLSEDAIGVLLRKKNQTMLYLVTTVVCP